MVRLRGVPDLGLRQSLHRQREIPRSGQGSEIGRGGDAPFHGVVIEHEWQAVGRHRVGAIKEPEVEVGTERGLNLKLRTGFITR
jgi:hypothetical protein